MRAGHCGLVDSAADPVGLDFSGRHVTSCYLDAGLYVTDHNQRSDPSTFNSPVLFLQLHEYVD